MISRQKILSFLKHQKDTWATLLMWVGAFLVVAGGVRLMLYTLPMLTGEYDQAAQAPLVGDKGIAWYDLGLSDYQRTDYYSATKILTIGYTGLTDADGQIPANRQRLAADYQLLIGNSLFFQQKLDAAAEAYKQALRHAPDDLNAKYNLELINQMQAGGQGGSPKGPPSGQAGKGQQKGI